MTVHSGLGIRTATMEDAAVLAALAGQLGYPTTAEQMEARLRVLLPDPRHAIVIASAQDRVIGWAAVEQRLTLEGGARTELVGLVVDEQQRGAGVGTRLLAAAEQWAVEHGAAEMKLRSNVLRERAHAFYEAQGYVRSKSQHMYIKTLQVETA